MQRKKTPLYISVNQKPRKGHCKTKNTAKAYLYLFRWYPVKKWDHLERKYYRILPQNMICQLLLLFHLKTSRLVTFTQLEGITLLLEAYLDRGSLRRNNCGLYYYAFLLKFHHLLLTIGLLITLQIEVIIQKGRKDWLL